MEPIPAGNMARVGKITPALRVNFRQQANPRFQRPNTFETRIDDDALVEARDRGTEPRLRRLKLTDYFRATCADVRAGW